MSHLLLVKGSEFFSKKMHIYLIFIIIIEKTFLQPWEKNSATECMTLMQHLNMKLYPTLYLISIHNGCEDMR